jgi:threonine aldolase
MGPAHYAAMTPAPLRIIDLRSDTITQPTPAMREAMAQAGVGDDVFGDDPTVKELEAETARLLGKEAAVFTPSGTMANQIAIRAQTEPGDEILVEANAHLYYYESGGPAALSGVMCRCMEGHRGIFGAPEVKASLRPANQHFPRTRMICLENTHNRGGGSIWPMERLAEVAAIAQENGLKMHLDGARLWNATAATGVPEEQFAAFFDTVNVCFSKGLGAPVGSALAGSAETIARARRFRKMFGGGMRQAGIVAAGALYALRHHRARLAEDHANAKTLAAGLTAIPGLRVNASEVDTNMVRIGVFGRPVGEVVAQWSALGILMLPTDHETIRAVTNLMVNHADMADAVNRIREAQS